MWVEKKLLIGVVSKCVFKFFFRFSIFYGFFIFFFSLFQWCWCWCCFQHMIPQVIVTPGYVSKFFIRKQRSQWYLRQSAVWVCCSLSSFLVASFLALHSAVPERKIKTREDACRRALTATFDNLTIFYHRSSVKVLWLQLQIAINSRLNLRDVRLPYFSPLSLI